MSTSPNFLAKLAVISVILQAIVAHPTFNKNLEDILKEKLNKLNQTLNQHSSLLEQASNQLITIQQRGGRLIIEGAEEISSKVEDVRQAGEEIRRKAEEQGVDTSKCFEEFENDVEGTAEKDGEFLQNALMEYLGLYTEPLYEINDEVDASLADVGYIAEQLEQSHGNEDGLKTISEKVKQLEEIIYDDLNGRVEEVSNGIGLEGGKLLQEMLSGHQNSLQALGELLKIFESCLQIVEYFFKV